MDSMITQCLNKTEITAPCNQNSHFDSLSKEKQEQLIEWCKANPVFRGLHHESLEEVNYPLKLCR